MKISYRYILLPLFILISCFVYAQQGEVKWKNVKVLVYTKNGKGYVHDNIESSVKCIQKLGQEKGFTVVASDDPSVFTEDNLKQYTFLLFANTNNDVFDTNEQRLAFRKYIEDGWRFCRPTFCTGNREKLGMVQNDVRGFIRLASEISILNLKSN